MFLKFNEGAIIRLSLLGFSEPTIIVGKVIEVSPTTVELCPQLLVYRNGKQDYSCSADADSNIYVRRSLIHNWQYAKLKDFPYHSHHISDSPNPSHGAVRKNKPFDSFVFNYYGDDGLCRGNGPYCGNIKEEPSNIIINFEKTVYDDGK